MSELVQTPGAGLVEAISARPTWVRWRIVALLMAFSFMNHFNRVSMAVAGDEVIMKRYHISTTAMGTVYSAFLLAYTLCMTPGGLLIDRWGSKVCLVAMGFGTGLFCILTGYVGMGWLTGAMILPGLLVVRSLMGMLASPLHPASGRAVSHWFPPDRRAWPNGLALGAALVGIASVYKVFGTLIELYEWPFAFACSGTCTVLLALLWFLYGTDSPTQHRSTNAAERALILGSEPAKRKPFSSSAGLDDLGHGAGLPETGQRSLLRNRSIVLLTLSYAAVGYFEYLFMYWMHFYFEDRLKLGKAASQYYSGIPLLVMAACMPLGGWLSDRLMRSFGRRVGRAVVPAAGMFASAVLLILGIMAREPVWIVTWFALAMGAVGMSEGPFWTTAIELGGRRGGTSGGIVNTGGNGGGLLAPTLTPWVADYFGWQWAISLGALFCLLGVVLWFWIDPDDREA